MARSKEVEYERDEFDNPPAGPVGLHRGKPSAWPRVTAFLVVLFVALVLCGIMYAYGIGVFGGKNAEARNGADASQVADSSSSKDAQGGSSSGSTATDASKDSKDSQASSGSSDASSKNSSSDSSSSSEKPKDSQASDAQQQSGQSSDSNKQDDASKQNDGQTQQAQADPSTQVLVLNATATTGLAQQQAGVLQGQGYSAVTYGNASGYSYTYPSQNTVWYSDESSLATAQDIAARLGIAQVAQAQGLTQPVVVVYVG